MDSRITFLLVGFIALLSWRLLSTEQSQNETHIENKHFIDVFINDFTITSKNASGHTDYTLKANRLEHYNDEDNSTIIKPEINLPQQSGSWIISADFGKVDDKQTYIHLHDNVVMQQQNSSNSFVLKTASLTINTQSKIIESDLLVSIQTDALLLKSNGMIFNGNSEKLKLLSKVSGKYVPK